MLTLHGVFLLAIQFAASFSAFPDPEPGVYYNCEKNGTIAVTFDDGPLHSKTPGVLDVLRLLNVPATFFIVGQGFGSLDNPLDVECVLRAKREGHYIAHHTWSHQNLTAIDNSTLLSEMHLLSDKLDDVINYRPPVMRPPYGEYNDNVVDIIHRQLNFSIILWSIDTNDWAHPGDTQAGLQEYINSMDGKNPSLTPGFIALHHDPQNGSYDLAMATINYSRSLGYRYVSLAECLGFLI